MHSYDTDFFIRKVFTNERLFLKILDEFINQKCIILRSVLEQLTPNEHLYFINSELIRFRYEINKTSFESACESPKFKLFKTKYKEIYEYIEKNFKNDNTTIIDELINRITIFERYLQDIAPLYPTEEDEYLRIKQSDDYKKLVNSINIDDAQHLALLELYGRQRKIKIKFVSCDREDIVKTKAKEKIISIFEFIEPVDCEDYNS